ncbi:putative lipoyltransferase 2, mitochondrial [Orchesella cincta]|uniref:Octanoyl-[acyl-carrier-protein]:protein N-octanoyltransferase LIPT2, mitochondrial n=1 Tax=Orchesella cincta TaxID=48709 RepID=A0A1D2MZZ1_ORCCI|nr:putative lipoyltransferase 2, mitochondrial [Orchesella cincta]
MKVNDYILFNTQFTVYTFGLREKITDDDMKKLTESGAEVVKSDRGGLTTFHGPGQLVAYPVVNLRTFRNLSLRNYVNGLEMIAVHTCRMLGVFAVNGHESVSHTGAWANDKKICAIGVHCKRYVTTHGLALNCNTDIDWFTKIVPCGIGDKGVTSLAAELGRDVTVNDTIPQFLTSFESVLSCRIMEVGKEDALFKECLEYTKSDCK